MKVSGKLVLLVDDTPSNVQALAEVLCTNGFQICVAENGEEAIETAVASRPDLILMDISMPGMDGLEACRRMKKIRGLAEIPVIFLTGNTDHDYITQAFRAGGADYLTKPVNNEELLIRADHQLKIAAYKDRILRESEARKELLHVLCHDLLNPLCSAKGFLDLLEKNPGKSPDYVSKITSALNICEKIIEINRTKMSVEEGTYVVNTAPEYVSELIGESLQTLKHRIKDKNLKVDVRLSGNKAVVVDRIPFVYFVLNNILTNCIKFSHEGGLILISDRQDGTEYTLVFRDYGIGISPDALEEMEHGEIQTRLGTGGEKSSGFGMQIIKKHIHDSGARFLIESWVQPVRDQKRGTRVGVVFPEGSWAG